MTFHESFWVAAATVGPVIGLAEAVTLTRYLRWRDSLRELVRTLESSLPAGDDVETVVIEGEPILGESSDPLLSDVEEVRDALRLASTSLGRSKKTLEDLTARIRTNVRIIETQDTRSGAAVLLTLALTAAGFSLGTTTVALWSLALSRDLIQSKIAALLSSAAIVALVIQSVVEVVVRRTARRDKIDAHLPE